MNEVNVDLEALPIGEDAPGLVNVVVEVPVGSRNKYEYEPELGVIMRDRVLPGNVRFPADYGFVPSTESADGEPLDAMVAAYDPVFPGCVIRARVVGALEMDEGGDGVQHLRRPRRRSPLQRHRGSGGYARTEPARDRAVLRRLQAA
jgi:inorganic pyrophosphatase